MRKPAVLMVWATVASCGLSGCGSMFNLGFTPCGTNHNAGKIYGGVRNDIGLLTSRDTGATTRAFGVVDLTLSFAVDTVALPLVVPIALAKHQKAMTEAAKKESSQEIALPPRMSPAETPASPVSGKVVQAGSEAH